MGPRARHDRIRAIALGGLLLPIAGCHRTFTCDDDAQCHLDGVQGTCEANGACSFPADDCPSGRRYGEHAASGIAGSCVEQGELTAVAETGSSSSVSTSGTSSAQSSDASSVGSSDGTGDADPCNGLTESGAVVVTTDDAVIAGLRVVADGDGITVDGHSNVTIRDSEIHHQGGRGIVFRNADGLTIENVVIVHDGAPPMGPHESGDEANIDGADSTGVRIDHVRLTAGSSGIVLASTPGAQLSFVEGHDVRGPGYAAFVRLFRSDGAVLEDFSIENPLDTGRPGDLVAVVESSDITVRRGLLDGHNSQFGYGVHVVHTQGQHSGALVEDVDGVRMTNGAFSCFPYGNGITFRRTRARDNICEILSVPIDDCGKPGPNGGCIPGSDGVSWTASGDSDAIAVEASSYTELCTVPSWPDEIFATAEADGELAPAEFEPRAPIRITTCWE